ncbi:helix-turn-helix domain-containing protein [Lysinibacillus sp. NPDC098008]|uniref:helix-turn-helix domain-containing protein n=1 Tax=Lysinibacillus sp. NPDC098008 TaxID=3364146 RepID=UPI003826D810
MVNLDDIKHHLESYLVHDGFGKILKSLKSESDNFNYSLESIKRELALQKEKLQKPKSIGQIINELMIKKGIEKSSYIYERANISRDYWSKLISNKIKEPSLKVLYKLAITFELNIEETNTLLSNFNRAFSEDASMLDQIVAYFINEGIYSPELIDQILYEFEEETLFSTN